MPTPVISPNTEDQVIGGLMQKLPPGMKFDLAKVRQQGVPNAAIIKYLQGKISAAPKAPPKPEAKTDPMQFSGPERFTGSAIKHGNPHLFSGISALVDAVRHPIDAMKGFGRGMRDQVVAGKDAARAELAKGNPARAAIKAYMGGIPGYGPEISEGVDQASRGDLAGAAGTFTGTLGKFGALNVAPETGIGGAPLKARANKMFRKATGVTSPEAADLLIANKATTPAKAGEVLTEATGKVDEALKKVTSARKVSPGAIRKEMDAIKTRYGAASDKAAVAKVESDFLSQLRTAKVGAVRNMSPEEAETMARAQETSAAGLKGKAAEKAARVGIARALRRTLEDQFPELKTPYKNRYYLQQAVPEMEAAVKNGVAEGTKGKIRVLMEAAAKKVIAGGIGYTVGHVPGMLVSTGVDFLMSRPTFRAKMAIALSRAAGIPVPQAAVRLWGFSNALKNAGKSEPQ